MSARPDRSTLGLLATTAIAPVLFGTTYVTATSGLLPDDRPLLVSVLRAAPAALVLLLIARPRLPPVTVARAAAIGAVNVGAFFAFLFGATYALPTGIAATLTNTAPLFVLGLAPLVLGERPGGIRLLGGAVAVVGVALLVGADAGGLSAVGVALGFGAALSMAVGLVATRRWLQEVRPVDSAAIQLAAGAVVAALLALALEREAVPVGGGLVLGAAILSLVLTAVPYVLLFRGVRTIGPARTALLGPITPVVATLIGVAVLGESFTAPQVVGLVLVLVALVVAQVGVPRVGPRSRAPAAARG